MCVAPLTSTSAVPPPDPRSPGRAALPGPRPCLAGRHQALHDSSRPGGHRRSPSPPHPLRPRAVGPEPHTPGRGSQIHPHPSRLIPPRRGAPGHRNSPSPATTRRVHPGHPPSPQLRPHLVADPPNRTVKRRTNAGPLQELLDHVFLLLEDYESGPRTGRAHRSHGHGRSEQRWPRRTGTDRPKPLKTAQRLVQIPVSRPAVHAAVVMQAPHVPVIVMRRLDDAQAVEAEDELRAQRPRGADSELHHPVGVQDDGFLVPGHVADAMEGPPRW